MVGWFKSRGHVRGGCNCKTVGVDDLTMKRGSFSPRVQHSFGDSNRPS